MISDNPAEISLVKAADRGIQMEDRIKLPEAFTERMQQVLGEEFEAFQKSFEESRYQGLRVNELKISREDFLKLGTESAFVLKPIPWCETGFYYGYEKKAGQEQAFPEEEIRPGRHVWHEAGFYYIQEPSAMSAAGLLEAKPGERILDLCAAPGGKSSQLAAAMKGEGLLVVNEIHSARAKILSQNMERMGVRNVLVCNESPDRLAERFTGFFDRILCDAPCSGEGMFRKDEAAISEWSPEHVTMCADRQLSILQEAEKMLKAGGRLVYSTCTFSDAENEEVIARFQEICPWMEPDLTVDCPHFDRGRLPGTWRLWPHHLEGEGHGVAVLRKSTAFDMLSCTHTHSESMNTGKDRFAIEQDDAETAKDRFAIEQDDAANHRTAKESGDAGVIEKALSLKKSRKKEIRQKRGKKTSGKGGRIASGQQNPNRQSDAESRIPWEDQKRLKEFHQWEAETLTGPLIGEFLFFGDQLYLVPEGCPPLHGLKVLRPGLQIGELRGKLFKPAHALAMALHPDEVRQCVQGSREEIYRYLHGETIPCGGEKGWVLVCVDSVSVGWGKADGENVKNHYPKGLRINW